MKHHRFNKCAIALALFGSGVAVQAEEPVKLNEITVKGEAMKESDRSFTVNVISADTIQSQRWENPLAIFEEVPGVEGRSNQSGSVAPSVSIRGLSSGGHGGDLGFSLDGITMNEAEGHADGFAETNVIIPLELESLAVYKGPVSPLYGNFARGGVMAFTTRKGGRYADAHLATGAFETNDGQAAFGTKIGAVQLNGAIQGYESEGWRDNSRFSKTNTAFRGAYSLSDRSEVALSLRGHGATFEGPGNITRDQFLDDDRRSQQAPTLVGRHDGGEKKYSSQRVDFNHLINDKMKLLTFVYNTKMDITRFESSGTGTTPQIERTHDRDVIAFGGSLNGEHRLFDVPTHWVLGTERYNEETHENQWQTTARTRGVKDRDRDFTINTTSLYGQMDLDVHPRFRPTLGFRYDGFDGSLKNRLNNTETDLNDFNRLSPKLGVRSELTSNWELRASVANGFGLPSSTQKYDPTVNVDAVEFWQYEIGINGAPSPQWYMDLAAFVLDSSDEIQQVPNSVPPEFVNAGESRRIGLEGELRYYPPAIRNLELSTGFGIFNTEIVENIADPTLEGNELQQIPKYVANIAASYAPESGLGGSLKWRSLGSYYTNNQNTGEYEGYDVVNASLFYTVRGEGNQNTRWYLDINNLTNEVYAESVSGADAQGQPTSFNPRPPINVMIGVIVSLM